jgi:hypothetical protein
MLYVRSSTPRIQPISYLLPYSCYWYKFIPYLHHVVLKLWPIVLVHLWLINVTQVSVHAMCLYSWMWWQEVLYLFVFPFLSTRLLPCVSKKGNPPVWGVFDICYIYFILYGHLCLPFLYEAHGYTLWIVRNSHGLTKSRNTELSMELNGNN